MIPSDGRFRGQVADVFRVKTVAAEVGPGVQIAREQDHPVEVHAVLLQQVDEYRRARGPVRLAEKELR